MIFLKSNVLLEKPLKLEDVKPRLLGHWGTCPGLILIWSHLNLLIRNHHVDMLFVIGPGHGAPAALAALWLEGSLQRFYPDKYSVDRKGLTNLITQFSVPGGFPRAWHAIKYLDPAESGAVIPILHVNGFKIMEALDKIDEELFSALEWALAEVRRIQAFARQGKPIVKPRWPMIVLRTPKGWGGPKRANTDESHLAILQEWLDSYDVGRLLSDGQPTQTILDALPKTENWRTFVLHKGQHASSMKETGKLLDKVARENPKTFRLFSPDELESNKLDSILDHTGRNFQWDEYSRAKDGRVIEILSEHTCQGFMQGYTLTGRTAIFPSYESFLGIIHTMIVQYSKFNKIANELDWRRDISSVNYIETSTWARQEHNGFSHQNPSFIGAVLNLKADAARVYLPPDANFYLSSEDAAEHCRKGASVWRFASCNDRDGPDVVLVGIGVEVTFEVVKAAELLRGLVPELKVRVVNVTDLLVLAAESRHPHALSRAEFLEMFTEDKPVCFNYHGYETELQGLLFGRPGLHRMTVEGYKEEGSTTTPFDMMIVNRVSRFDVAARALKAAAGYNATGHAKLDDLLAKVEAEESKVKAFINSEGKGETYQFRASLSHEMTPKTIEYCAQQCVSADRLPAWSKNLAILSFLIFVQGWAGASESMQSSAASEAFHVSKTVEALSTAMYLFGVGTGAPFAGPISETIGRNPTYFVGLFSSPVLSVNGSTVRDQFRPVKRALIFPMIAWVNVVGPVLAPVASGWMPVLLDWKAKELRRATGDPRYVSQHSKSTSFFRRLSRNLKLGASFWRTEVIVIALGVYLLLLYSLLFSFLTGFDFIFKETYGLSTGLTGSCFASVAAGATAFTCSAPWLYNLARDRTEHVRVVTAVYVSSYEYISDSYGDHSAIALSSITMARYLAAGGMVMASRPMYQDIGVHWTMTIMGTLSALLAPAPLCLWRYGFEPDFEAATDRMTDANSATPHKVAITNVRVFDGQGLTAPTTITICGGVIGDGDASGAHEIDGTGKFLFPGFIDTHVHLSGARHQLEHMAKWGVTTALGMGEWSPEKVNALRGSPGLTDIRSAGIPATTPGSLHSKMLPIDQNAFVTGPEDSSRFVKDRLAQHADYIKIVADVPGPDQDTINALVAESHSQEKLVVTHAATYSPFTMALAGRPDFITHVPRDKVLDEEDAKDMAQKQIVSIPTLAMMATICRPLPWSAVLRVLLQPSLLLTVLRGRRSFAGPEAYRNCTDSVMQLHRASVQILVGTDSNEEEDSPFTIPHGESFHREMELLVEAGLSTVEVLKAGTSLAAGCFGLEDRGAIEPGKRADLVLLAANPLDEIRSSRKIDRVWLGGVALA
ncbi:xylulose-5-phosphate/fructose-6-phosphate phosphoketolase [Purpureocillium lavendulum]|uniref:Xylulose-5-phosphate/fructose-6-phosphate phosphoketolase n=1 Tax=Purpureocillium lavendulum TaxID=1247861 RepID=A0AB34FEJ8_9HYPO|nr:xylulose-5-phosphate/fructose-6-phosphate phosphoketolase [Purpureocillium lavendulum]